RLRRRLCSRLLGADHVGYSPASRRRDSPPANLAPSGEMRPMRAERLAATIETLEGYGMRQHARSRVARPRTIEETAEIFVAARPEGVSVGLRGGGNSYGDAALNGDAIVLDTSRMNRILAWDPHNGIITCEPGVTIARLWRATLADGWWPPVVPGT